MDQLRTGGWTWDARIASAVPVELARAEAFDLNGLHVEPGLRRVSTAEASERIEPRVMQLLVALARAEGAILSREDLLDSCWDGRAVSDDAINRVVSRLRKALAAVAGDAVRVETLSRVGYRLVVSSAAGAPASTEYEAGSANDSGGSTARPPAVGGRVWGWRAWPAAAALGAIAAAGVWFAARLPAVAATTTRVGVEAVVGGGGDREARKFASDLTGDLARLASANSRVDVIDRSQPGAASDSDFLMRISVDREAGRLAATARLIAADDGTVLWSRGFVDEAGSAARLREQVAFNAAGLMRCGLERSTKSLGDAASLRLFFSACDALQDRDFARAETFARQVVKLRPDSAAGWACLAMTSLMAGEAEGGKAFAGKALRRRAAGYARKALAIDPQVGRAYIVLAAVGELDPQALTTLEQGIRADPEMPGLHKFYSLNLYNLGYVKASVGPALRGLALDPTQISAYELAARRLLLAGRTEEAFAMLARAERIWPDSPGMAEHRLRFLLYLPDPQTALVQFESLEAAGKVSPTQSLLTEEILRWRVDPRSLDLAALDSEAEALYERDPVTAWYLTWAMLALDQPDRAIAWLARAPKRNAMNQWSLLFAAETATIRRDPRFFKAMAELGLVDLWRKRGQWPDFCSEPGLRYSCAQEARRPESTPKTA